jgi:hypothetical protein
VLTSGSHGLTLQNRPACLKPVSSDNASLALLAQVEIGLVGYEKYFAYWQ